MLQRETRLRCGNKSRDLEADIVTTSGCCLGLVTSEGLLMAVVLTVLPLVILWVLVKLLPPWPESNSASLPAAPAH